MSHFRNRIGRLIAVVVGTVGLAAGLVLLGVLLRWFGLQNAANYAQLLSIPLAVIPLVVALWAWFRRGPARVDRPSSQVLDRGGVPLVMDAPTTVADRAAMVLPEMVPVGSNKSTSALALGVRPAIPLSDHTDELDEDLPRFVTRTILVQLRRVLRRAQRVGGFCVLVGDSSVGKTRVLYEAVAEVLPEFAMLVPDPGDGEAVNALVEVKDVMPPMVVWLDQLHRFLDGPFLLEGDTPVRPRSVRRLLAADTPVVLLGTVWPEHLRELLSFEDVVDGHIRPVRYPAAHEILEDSRCRRLSVETFSQDEREAAESLRDVDPRITEALQNSRFNVTEGLAGVPRLMRRYAEATDGLKALVHAAVDAQRIGVHSPLSASCLREAGRAHLRGVHADDQWFDDALAEAVRHGSTAGVGDLSAVVVAVPDVDRRTVAGYVLADYLLQHLARERHREVIPRRVWGALVREASDEADIGRLADAAEHRCIFRIAIPQLCRLVVSGRAGASTRLTSAFTQWGNVRQLKKVTAPFRWQAKEALARIAARVGDRPDVQAGVESGPTEVFVFDSRLRITLDRRSWRLADLLMGNVSVIT